MFGPVLVPYLCGMAINPNTRDRIECWPLKGTRRKLAMLSKRKGYPSMTSYINAILEREAASE